MNTPPGTPRSRSFTRFTMRVGLPHFGQSVLLEVSITFLRSAVLAILAILYLLAKFSREAAGPGEMIILSNSGVLSRAGNLYSPLLILHEECRHCLGCAPVERVPSPGCRNSEAA